VGVAAELRDDAGVGQGGQIRGHHRHRAAEVAEGRGGHQVILQLDERREAAVHGAGKKIERGGLARFGVKCVVLLAADLLAPRLTEIAPFFRSCPVHERHHIPSGHPVQRGEAGGLDFWVEDPVRSCLRTSVWIHPSRNLL
jgi:hypothetical protein